MHLTAQRPFRGAAETGSKGDEAASGFAVVAHALANAGVKNIYGVIGIPVTELASAAQVWRTADE